VHASGEMMSHRPWAIPKGTPDAGETPIQTAIRETAEETGVHIDESKLGYIGFIDYVDGHGKDRRVFCFTGEDTTSTPTCASWEVDRSEFVPLEEARKIINPAMLPFLDRLSATM
jgi:8-oxo-(d)GTP phosphatase